MKKTLLGMGAALTLSGMLVGCGTYDNAATNRSNPQRAQQNVNYQPNAAQPPAGQPTTPDNAGMSQPTGRYNADRRLARRVAAKADTVKGVDRAHVVVNGKNVLVGAVADKNTDRKQLGNQVKAAVRPLVGNRDVYVTTDRRYLNRITALEPNFNAGRGMREVSTDITGIIDDLSNALKRPFQNNTD
mgnify:CR=1 FL=1